ncbi:Toxin FitB [Aquisphaera giovannonii]|uniref:Ribonuclease VapC n=1 Tax=Aquisphaera giovannonii TaxID=406548 RepID=A0A5B9W8E6_9BACT|nr:type II toxin-antitoxin system VapC family toxin [Aquisphaera giovannonii]QEH36355.1 Toxin FitB [Aquisphaera giovannonii]
MFLLDTEVISELRKAAAGKADPNVTSWARSVSAGSLFLSTIVVQELEIGVLQLDRRDAHQGAILRVWLDDHVLPSFVDRILPVDIAVPRRGAALHVPNPGPFRDAFIAATGIVHGMTVVTRNLADFAATGVPLVNPWDASP